MTNPSPHIQARARLARTFPISTKAWTRLRLNWRLWWAGYHVFAAIDRLEKIGPRNRRGS